MNKFIIDLLEKLLVQTERNNLDQTYESFWLTIYDLPRDEDVANRSNDQNVRILIELLTENKMIDVIETIEIKYTPTNVSVENSSKILDAVQLKIKDIGKIQSLSDRLVRMGTKNIKASYEIDRRILYIGKHQVKFRGSSELSLMEAIFKNKQSMRKTWHNDELREVKDPYPDSSNIAKNWGTATADNINSKKIKLQTGINDLFIINEGFVKVNPHYLS